MDIQTFSTTYWYIWFLVVLLIVILLIVNGIGLLVYRKKRQNFLNKSNRLNENIPMDEISTITGTTLTSSNNRSNYQTTSTASFTTSSSSYTRSSRIRNLRPTMLLPKISTIPETLESPSFSHEKSEMDLSLEEFQRQALNEHNAMRTMYKKLPLKLNESLSIYAQYWAEQCAEMNQAIPSRTDWRLSCKGQPIGENIVSIKSTDTFDGAYFTALIMANGNQSHEVDCVLNEISNEVGFGCAQSQPNDDSQQQQWIGVAHYYPYHQLTTVQS